MYFDGCFYHVYNRGAHKARIFTNRSDYESCLHLMRVYEPRYRVIIVSYSLMPNHYHMVLQQAQDGSISRFIQATFNAYSQGFNLKYKHSGTLFQGKAKNRRIAEEAVPNVVRYLHLNPVLAELVDNPQDWKFSDCAAWCGKWKASDIHCKIREDYFPHGSAYKEFLESISVDPRNFRRSFW